MISLIPTYLAEWANRLGHRQSTPDSPKIARGSTHGIRLRAWSESLGRPAVHGLREESLPCRPADTWVPLPSAQNVGTDAAW
jgi:hypothetical protein